MMQNLEPTDTHLKRNGKFSWLFLVAVAFGAAWLFLDNMIFLFPCVVCLVIWFIDYMKADKEWRKEHDRIVAERRAQREALENARVRLVLELRKRLSAQLSAAVAAFDAELAEIPRAPVTLSEKPAARHDISVYPEIGSSNITRRTNLKKLFPLVVLDTETTGFSPQKCEIIELSAIRYEAGFRPVSCYTTLVKPRRKIPPNASAVNNITDEMVKDSPPIADLIAGFQEYVSGCNIVGHNLPFDLKFLHVAGLDLTGKRRFFDTLELSKYIVNSDKEKYTREGLPFVPDRKLDTLCISFGIFRAVAHRSLSDCLATGKLFQKFVETKTASEADVT